MSDYRPMLEAELTKARSELARMARSAKAWCDAQHRPYPPQLQSLVRWLEAQPDSDTTHASGRNSDSDNV